MGEKEKVAELKVKHSGFFDFREIYSFIYTLLSDLEYSVEEKNYGEKTKGDQKEIEVNWLAKRKISDYFRFIVKVDIRTFRMANADVVKDGVKTSVNKGDFEVKFTAFLEKDYENRWENTAFVKFLRGLYEKYIIPSAIDSYSGQLEDEANSLSNQTKALLDLAGKK
ncbi:MAG: hypothetical protein KKE23_00515 [Nanoarchaeota archaeon]|nr:hypothetical protein [Nanoarchaeota archaeon]